MNKAISMANKTTHHESFEGLFSSQYGVYDRGGFTQLMDKVNTYHHTSTITDQFSCGKIKIQLSEIPQGKFGLA